MCCHLYVLMTTFSLILVTFSSWFLSMNAACSCYFCLWWQIIFLILHHGYNFEFLSFFLSSTKNLSPKVFQTIFAMSVCMHFFKLPHWQANFLFYCYASVLSFLLSNWMGFFFFFATNFPGLLLLTAVCLSTAQRRHIIKSHWLCMCPQQEGSSSSTCSLLTANVM